MTNSYTQISQHLTCPPPYRHRYLDVCREKDTRAAMLFGRAFESTSGAPVSPGRSRCLWCIVEDKPFPLRTSHPL